MPWISEQSQNHPEAQNTRYCGGGVLGQSGGQVGRLAELPKTLKPGWRQDEWPWWLGTKALMC